MMNSWREILAQFKEEFDKGDEFEELIDGIYQARVAGANLETSKKGDPMVKFTFVIADGPYRGRRQWKYHVLKSGNIRFLKSDLNKLGLKLGEITELPSRLREIIDQPINLVIETKHGQNGKDYRLIKLEKPQPLSDDLPF
jgi:hypothetical protein